MRALALGLSLALALTAQPVRASSLAREPLLRSLRQATPRVRACARRHQLEPGRYVVRLTILEGRARWVRLVQGTVSSAGRACLVAAFSAPSYPELASLEDGAPEVYRVSFPFVIAPGR